MSTKEQIGGKALQLSRLKAAGFPVPNFVVVTSEQVTAAERAGDWKDLAQNAIKTIGAEVYAVRSSAANEDAPDASLAGAFATEVDVPTDGVAAAMQRIAEDAKQKRGSLRTFGIIVQAFIEPEIAGVVFTRHPSSGREMVVEWHEGRGDALVSGRVAPKRVSWVRHQPLPTPFLLFPNLADIGVRIEELFGAPQDIEWCIAGESVWIVQSRPITTRTTKMNETDAELDWLLPKTDFIFEKTGVCDVAPRPCSLTIDLLRAIYQKHGPVDQSYRALGVSYCPEEALEIVGNQLYIDLDAEVRTLFPSFGRVAREAYQPGFVRFRGIWKTLRNMTRFASLKLPEPSQWIQRIQASLRPINNDLTPQAAVDELLLVYKDVFTINLLAERALSNLAHATQPWKLSHAALLSGGSGAARELRPPDGLVGNGLDVADQSVFRFEPGSHDNAISEREINRAPREHQDRLRRLADLTRTFVRLRECARWLTVREVSQLRASILLIGKQQNLDRAENIFFASLEEVLGGSINTARCEERRKTWESGNRFTFPARLSGRVRAEAAVVQGLSPGNAVGVLVEREQLASVNAKPILWTDDLSPNLVDLFDDIAGIVASRGGLLSHCAIVARERGIPVVVSASAHSLIGKVIRIDGSVGVIEVVL